VPDYSSMPNPSGAKRRRGWLFNIDNTEGSGGNKQMLTNDNLYGG